MGWDEKHWVGMGKSQLALGWDGEVSAGMRSYGGALGSRRSGGLRWGRFNWHEKLWGSFEGAGEAGRSGRSGWGSFSQHEELREAFRKQEKRGEQRVGMGKFQLA